MLFSAIANKNRLNELKNTCFGEKQRERSNTCKINILNPLYSREKEEMCELEQEGKTTTALTCNDDVPCFGPTKWNNF